MPTGPETGSATHPFRAAHAVADCNVPGRVAISTRPVAVSPDSWSIPTFGPTPPRERKERVGRAVEGKYGHRPRRLASGRIVQPRYRNERTHEVGERAGHHRADGETHDEHTVAVDADALRDICENVDDVALVVGPLRYVADVPGEQPARSVDRHRRHDHGTDIVGLDETESVRQAEPAELFAQLTK